MQNFRQIEDELYISIYGIPKKGDSNQIWNSIKFNDEILAEAIGVEKDKFGQRDLVKGLAICDCMLIDYESVNQEIYQKLVNLIYSNTDIARIVLDGASNGGYSYLLMTLWNPNLKLTEEQKQFAVSEAMNQLGTTKYEQRQEEFSKKLDDMGITDDEVIMVEMDECGLQPCGRKTANEYMNFMFSTLSDTQAHGTSPFDIRYQILRNSNWTLEEKQKLVYDFWTDDETYDEYLEQWEWGIINDEANYKGESLPQLDKAELYEYTYQTLLDFYGDELTTDNIWNEINFCRTMHLLRPQKWEIDEPYQKVI